MHDFLARYFEEGYSFFNTGSDQKKVLTSWTRFQHEKPTKQEINTWLKARTQNYAIVCGEISNLVVFDIDTKNGADPTPFQNLGMFEIQTPSGGYHFYCQYDPLLKSTKHQKPHTSGLLKAVDIQSNGSLVFAPPSKFPNGEYIILNDVPVGKVPENLLAQVLAALEPEKEAKEYTPYQPTAHFEKGRPGDLFNALATWEEVLEPQGWKKVGRTQQGIQYWRRPGKTDGISASTNWKTYDLFFPFTSSMPPLVPTKGYTKFAFLAATKYDNNFEACAKALVMENYRLAHNLV